MSATELRWVNVLRPLREKRITHGEAGEVWQWTDRQIRRLFGDDAEGAQGLVHRGRGKPSNRRISEKRNRRSWRGTRSGIASLGQRGWWRSWPSGTG
jgi:hypothetical protein